MRWRKLTENAFLLLIAIKVGLLGFFFFTDRIDQLGSLAKAFAQQETAAPSTPGTAPEQPGVQNPSASAAGTGMSPSAKNEPIQGSRIDLEVIQANEVRKKELDQKEEELKRKEDRLKTMERDLEEKIEELKRVQLRIDQQVSLRKDLEQQGILKLAKVYEGMPAEEAAKLIETMDRDVAVQVLSNMRGRQAGKILASVKPDIASRISEQIVKKQ